MIIYIYIYIYNLIIYIHNNNNTYIYKSIKILRFMTSSIGESRSMHFNVFIKKLGLINLLNLQNL